MTDKQLAQLRASDPKTLRLMCSDGEIIEAQILFVDEEYRDVVCDLVSTTKPEKYNQAQGICIAVKWDDIADLQEISP